MSTDSYSQDTFGDGRVFCEQTDFKLTIIVSACVRLWFISRGHEGPTGWPSVILYKCNIDSLLQYCILFDDNIIFKLTCGG